MRGLHRSAMPCLRRSAMRCLPSFCLLAMLAFCRKALPCLPSFPAENSCLLRQKPQKFAAHFRPLGAFPRLPSQGRALLTTFCLLAMLAFLPQGRALRQKPQKFAAHFQSSGTLPKPRAVRFRALGVLPRLYRHIFTLWERSHAFSEAFSAFGSAPEDFPKRFHLSKVLLLLPRRVFGLRVRSQSLARLVFSLWECSIAACCTALSFGSLPECSHRHCPRVARKSYKIFSSGG